MLLLSREVLEKLLVCRMKQSFSIVGIYKSLLRRICKSPVPRMTTWLKLILKVKDVCARATVFQQLVRKMILLVLSLNLVFSASQLFSNCFFFPTVLAIVLSSFCPMTTSPIFVLIQTNSLQISCKKNYTF